MLTVLEENHFENQTFSDLTIAEDMSNKKFVRCKFNAIDFSGLCAISNCSFDSCTFISPRFNGVDIKDCAFLSCTFKYGNFFAAKFTDCKMTGSSFVEPESLTDIIGGDWSYTSLRHIDFQKQKFDGTNFGGADLTGCRFNKCAIKNCDFSQAMMSRTSFQEADLRSSLLNQIDLAGVNLKNAKVDLQQCVYIAETLMEVKYTKGNSKTK